MKRPSLDRLAELETYLPEEDLPADARVSIPVGDLRELVALIPLARAAARQPVTRLYRVKPGRSGWARLWVTDDGCLSIMSDWGSYAYWWGGDNGDHRRFLARCGREYVTSKLAGGKTEVDHDATVRGIKERVCRLRRNGGFGRRQAREEWELVESTDFEDERAAWRWYETTSLPDASEVLSHQTPCQLQMFMRHVWPLFVAQLLGDLGEPLREASRRWLRRAA